MTRRLFGPIERAATQLMIILLVACSSESRPIDGQAPSSGPERTAASPNGGDAARVIGLDRTACHFDELSRFELRVDDDPIYVNPDVVSVSERRVLLAGFPNHQWRTAKGRTTSTRISDANFGVIVENDSLIGTVPIPIAGLAHHPYAVARPEGGWYVVFFEVEEPGEGGSLRDVVGVWFGILEGKSWRLVERLSMPDQHTVRIPDRASLLLHEDTLMFAVIANPLGSVVMFERVAGKWSTHKVTVPIGALQLEPVNVGSLALVPLPDNAAGLLTQVSVPVHDRFHDSVVMYTRDPDWRSDIIIDHIAKHVGHGFSGAFDTFPNVVSWVSEGTLFAYAGTPAGGMLPKVIYADANRRDLIYSQMERLRNRVPLWLSRHSSGNELLLHTITADSVYFIGSLLLPYAFVTRHRAAYEEGDHFLLSFGRATMARPEIAASVMVRFRALCDAGR